MLFNIHRCNLRCTTDGPFAEDFPSTSTEVVQLTEDAKTLETLFAFVYPGAYPSLMNLPADELMRVAEAEEKYRVAPAIGVCLVVIRLGCVGYYLTYLCNQPRHPSGRCTSRKA